MGYGIFPRLTKEELLSKIDSYTLFKRYCKGFEDIGKAFMSPFRQEKNPSAYIIYYKGDLLFKDFGEEKGLRAIDFISRFYNLSFLDTLEKINNDMLFGEYEDISYNKIHFTERSSTVIKVKYREWSYKDTCYWGSHGISIYTLELFDVRPISHFSINGVTHVAEPLAYTYDYYWENNVFRRKIYQPLSTDNKWFSNGGAVVQGEGMLPYDGELLIFTSSLKDVMCLYEMEYISVAPTSEMTFVPDTYFEKQNKRFDKKVIFMNSDATGMERNKKLSERWSIPYIYIPFEYGCKDVSDLVKKIGINKTKELLKQLL